MTHCPAARFPRRANAAPPKRASEETDDARRRPPRRSETLFATPAIVADRRADGSIILKSSEPLQPARALCRRLAGALGAADAGADLPWRARQRRCAWTTVTYRDALRQVRSIAAWILAQRLSAERPLVHPLRQQRRSRAVCAGGDACRRALGGDLAGLFADVEDFDKLKSMIGAARARRDLCLRHKAVRGGACGDQAAAFGDHRQRQRRR